MSEQKLTGWQITWLLIKAPIMGALFALFLPFIGIAMVVWFLAKSLWDVGAKVEHDVVAWIHAHAHRHA